MTRRTKLLAISLAVVVGLGGYLMWKMSGTITDARAKANSAELQRLSGLLGVQFADTTELVQHGNGGISTGKYYHWFVRDLSATGELRSRFAKIGRELPASLGPDNYRKELAVEMTVPIATNATAYGYRWNNPGVQYSVSLYSINGSDWAKIMSFR